MNYRRAGQDDIAQLTTLRMAYLEADYGVLKRKFMRQLRRDCLLIFYGTWSGIALPMWRRRKMVS